MCCSLFTFNSLAYFVSRKMSEIPIHVRHCMLYEFELGHNAAFAARNICTVLGKGTVAERRCRFWFSRFHSGDKSLQDQPRAGSPVECDIAALRHLVEDN